MGKSITVERDILVSLIRNYKKSLNMLCILQYVCEQYSLELSMLPEEVCELIGLAPQEIERQRERGRLRYVEEEDGTKYYSIIDLINLKDTIDCKRINLKADLWTKLNDLMSFGFKD